VMVYDVGCMCSTVVLFEIDVLRLLVVCHTGANKFYREQLMCREQEPWLFRGGLLGEIQV